MKRLNYKRKTGVSVIVENEEQFNKVKDFLKPNLYIDWHENMLTRQTAVVLKANKNSDYSNGSVGCAEYQRSSGIDTKPFTENLIELIS